jgi:hypothetical protein
MIHGPWLKLTIRPILSIDYGLWTIDQKAAKITEFFARLFEKINDFCPR